MLIQMNFLLVLNCRGREFADPSSTGNDWGLFSSIKKNSYRSLDEKKKSYLQFSG